MKQIEVTVRVMLEHKHVYQVPDEFDRENQESVFTLIGVGEDGAINRPLSEFESTGQQIQVRELPRFGEGGLHLPNGSRLH